MTIPETASRRAAAEVFPFPLGLTLIKDERFHAKMSGALPKVYLVRHDETARTLVLLLERMDKLPLAGTADLVATPELVGDVREPDGKRERSLGGVVSCAAMCSYPYGRNSATQQRRWQTAPDRGSQVVEQRGNA